MYFPLLPSIFTKANQKIKKREEAEPQGHALAKRTYRREERTNKKMSVERKGAQCKLKAEAILEEFKSN